MSTLKAKIVVVITEIILVDLVGAKHLHKESLVGRSAKILAIKGSGGKKSVGNLVGNSNKYSASIGRIFVEVSLVLKIKGASCDQVKSVDGIFANRFVTIGVLRPNMGTSKQGKNNKYPIILHGHAIFYQDTNNPYTLGLTC